MFGRQMRWREMETETNAQFIMSPTYVNGCQQTVAFHTQVTSRHSFSQKDYMYLLLYINFRFVTGAIQNYRGHVRLSRPFLPQQLQVHVYMNIFKDKCNSHGATTNLIPTLYKHVFLMWTIIMILTLAYM